MNNVTLIGRLVQEVDYKTVGQGTALASFTIAIDRRFKNKNGEKETDFIRCVAWSKTAEFIVSNFGKGQRIGIVGEIQTRNYDDKDGKRVYVTEVRVDQTYFIEPKNQTSDRSNVQPQSYPKSEQDIRESQYHRSQSSWNDDYSNNNSDLPFNV